MNAMHIEELDLTQIRLLAELSRSRSVSRAAQRIGVSQSAASHALAKLRKKVADPLFTRGQDGFQPTPFGARLARASCEALDALHAGLAANDAFDPLTSARTFSFFMNDIGQTVFMPPLLKLLKTKAPGISARVLPVPLDNPGAPPNQGAPAAGAKPPIRRLPALARALSQRSRDPLDAARFRRLVFRQSTISGAPGPQHRLSAAKAVAVPP